MRMSKSEQPSKDWLATAEEEVTPVLREALSFGDVDCDAFYQAISRVLERRSPDTSKTADALESVLQQVKVNPATLEKAGLAKDADLSNLMMDVLGANHDAAYYVGLALGMRVASR